MFSLVFHFEFVTAVALSERARLRQEYYANTGALKRAAENARGGRRVGCSIVETFSKDVKPRELEAVLRLEYRSKLLNPKWAQASKSPFFGRVFV